MAKAKIVEKHSMSIEGIVDIDETNGVISLEIEDVGTKNLADLLTKFNGENVKISISLSSEITE